MSTSHILRNLIKAPNWQKAKISRLQEKIQDLAVTKEKKAQLLQDLAMMTSDPDTMPRLSRLLTIFEGN